MADEQQLEQEVQAPTRRGSGALGTFFLAFVMIAVLVAACVVGGYFFYMGGKEAPKFTVSGFDLDNLQPSRPVETSYTPPPKPLAASSPKPVNDLPDVTPGMKPLALQDSSGTTIGSSKDAKRDAQEKEWLAKNGKTLRETHMRLHNIAMQYYEKYPVVRAVDQAFGRMPRYMEIKKRFDKDGNPYAFAREAIALPEVRSEIARRMADPQAWKAALGMINDALKTKPPKAVYDEAKRFLREEDGVTDYLASEFQGNLSKNKTQMEGAFREAGDLTPIMKLAQDISPGGMPGMPGGMPALPGAQPPKR